MDSLRRFAQLHCHIIPRQLPSRKGKVEVKPISQVWIEQQGQTRGLYES